MTALVYIIDYTIYILHFFFLMLRPPPISTLFPYTTLFRSTRDFFTLAQNNRTRGHALTLIKNRSRVNVRKNFFSQRVVKDRKSTRLNSSHLGISYAVFCLKKKKKKNIKKKNKNKKK